MLPPSVIHMSAANVCAAASCIFFLGFCIGLTLGDAGTAGSSKERAIPSPRSTRADHRNGESPSALPYPPDSFPGSRDVDTPYGNLRVYEWGPEDGRKVVMVPGDTTPAPIFGPIAEALVERGFRVLLMDVFGRGYSDAPLNVAYDSRLFSTQVLLAVASSPLSWTGASSRGGFSLIGYSLGGPIAVSFASLFPYLLSSVVLLAPGGLLRRLPAGYTSPFFRYRRWVPSPYLRKLVGGILGLSSVKRGADAHSDGSAPPPVLLPGGAVDLPALWQWQFDNHRGFVHSFVETSQQAPLRHQRSEWQRAINQLNHRSFQEDPTDGKTPRRIDRPKLLVICGESDSVVNIDETREDVFDLAGAEHQVAFQSVPGGHDFPVSSAKATIEHIFQFWGIEL